MKRLSHLYTIYAINTLLIILLASSCVPLKKTKYLQDIPKDDTTTNFVTKAEDYRIKKGDNLYIRILSLEEKASNFFNPGSGASIVYSDPASVYLYSYLVDEQGYIQLPFIGDMQVRGFTVEELKDKIEAAVGEYLKETTVIVKLANFQITLIGEVNSPGSHWVFTSTINIFEALALAGDITLVGNRNKVKLVRTTENGSKIHYLDITDKKILESPLYYLEPFDIVYVDPIKARNFIFQQFPYGMIYTTIATVLLLITYLK